MKFKDVIVSEEKVRLDPKCWTGKKIGNPKTKVKGGVRVNNCVPAESVEEAANPAQQAAIAIAKKKKAGVDEAAPPGAKAERMVKHIKKGYAKDGKLSDKEKSIAYATAWKAHNKGVTEAMRPVPVDDQGNRIPDKMSSNAPNRPFGQPGDSKSSSQGVVTYTPTGIVHRSNHGDVTPRPRAVPEGSQRVDSLVTDALKIMQGSEASDAVAALKTVLGDREYNSRRGFYNFYVRQLMDMSGQQGVAEATGDEKFDTMMGQIQREPKYPDSQMPPTDVIDLYNWAVENNKLYHEIFAEWANREGYKSVAPALQRAGDLDTEALDYWTPRVWKIYWGEVRGIDSEMPPEWAKKRVPDELRDYLETVFDAYNRIVFDWPTEYRQIGMAEDYNPEYDDEAGMVENNLETLDRAVEGLDDLINSGDNLPEWCQEKIAVAKSMLVSVWDYMYSEEASDEVDPEVDEMFEAMDQLAEEMARKKGVSVDLVWETFEAMDDHMLYETAAWRRKEGKSAKGGLNAKGVASYRRENPGSKLQTAVTTKPSKLKPGSKAAKRRKSFCARMGGVKGPMKKPNGKPTRKALALRKWNCRCCLKKLLVHL